MQEKIRQKCDELRDLLLSKNKSYGNSAFEKGILFDVEPIQAIQARINDKLNRIKNKGEGYFSENDLQDLTGYFILLQVIMDSNEDLGPNKDTVLTKEWYVTPTPGI